jgi:endonuclease G, mitochondrial
MSDYSTYHGYDPKFINGNTVPLPGLQPKQQNDVAPVKGKTDGVADYMNYSLALSISRRFPYFTASNIDGKLFKKVSRKDNWRRDDRIAPQHQWGNELYKAKKSDFDRGHMTKREDTQWGTTVAEAMKAADSTFFFTNSVPQHAKLNQQIWRHLEDYILHTETKQRDMRVCVFTGPVLSSKDPDFVTEVSGETIKIPTLFWKVVVFPKSDGQLYRAGFMMSQESLLWDNDIVESFRDLTLETLDEEDTMFLEFSEAETYQVNISTIEKLSGLKMPPGTDIYKDPRSTKLVLKEIDVTSESMVDENLMELGFEIEGIRL